ncbi:hypothetical protein B0H19DRAFT_1250844 [Mycena capillaripes]|nr:hypothetical protein B0H19DRAFT_1250844 [Mycena capillaripes]
MANHHESLRLAPYLTRHDKFSSIVNVGSTCLITYRIWVVNRKAKTFNAGTLLPVAVVIVESGMVYAMFVVTLLALFLRNSDSEKPATRVVRDSVEMTDNRESSPVPHSNPLSDTFDMHSDENSSSDEPDTGWDLQKSDTLRLLSSEWNIISPSICITLSFERLKTLNGLQKYF